MKTYMETVKQIVRDFVDEYIDLDNYTIIKFGDYILDKLEDHENILDPEYTIQDAKEMIYYNIDEVMTTFKEVPHLTKEDVTDFFLKEDWMGIDTLVRQYFLYSAVMEVASEIKSEMTAKDLAMLVRWFKQNCDEDFEDVEAERKLIEDLMTIRGAMPSFYNTLVSAAIK